jgi:hypothetical protein
MILLSPQHTEEKERDTRSWKYRFKHSKAYERNSKCSDLGGPRPPCTSTCDLDGELENMVTNLLPDVQMMNFRGSLK